VSATDTSLRRKLSAAESYIAEGIPIVLLFGQEKGRCSCGDAECSRVAKHPRTKNGVKDATFDMRQVKEWLQRWPKSNIGIATGSISELVVLDVDGSGGRKALKKLKQTLCIRKFATRTVRTGGGGLHLYFRCAEQVPMSAGKLGEGLDIRGEGGYVVAPPSIHVSGKYYRTVNKHREMKPLPSSLLGLLKSPPVSGTDSTTHDLKEGSRNTSLTSLGGAIRRAGLSAEAIDAALQVENLRRCEPPLASVEISRIAASVSRYSTAPETAVPPTFDRNALIGLTKEFVESVEPFSESDPAALLIQLVVAAGNVVGRSPHFSIESTPHHLNLFCTVVGETSVGRKGTALGHALSLIRPIDPGWAAQCIRSGLSSGEGIVNAIRDAGPEDEGVADKRGLIIETEFGSVLKTASRQGNILSGILRQCWDGDNLQTLTKHSPLRASNPHISIIAHITPDEVRKGLNDVDQVNGFANRFLWVWAQRSKSLPHAKAAPIEITEQIRARLQAAIAGARNLGEIGFSRKARLQWATEYELLSQHRPGLAGALLARGEAQVRRLSAIYSVLEGSPVIKRSHLRAALALWHYCEASTVFVFGGSSRSLLSEKILQMLRSAGQGVGRTEITQFLGGHHSSAALSAALGELLNRGVVEVVQVRTKGRSAEQYFAR
jgi:hypothetical protein